MRRRGRPPVAPTIVSMVLDLRSCELPTATIAEIVDKSSRSVEAILYRERVRSKPVHPPPFISTCPAIQPALPPVETHI